jgi:hypothetical protein
MKIKFIVFLIVLIISLLLSSNKTEEFTTINLRFSQNFPGEKIENSKTGLLWALSFLGASLPESFIEKGLVKKDSTVYTVNLNKAGFNKTALNAFRELIKKLKETEEYNVKNGIELGEFITLTLGSSWHYYEITGAEKNFSDFKRKHQFTNSLFFPVIKSDVAYHHRLIEMVKTEKINEMAFIAYGGEGSLVDSTFVTEIFEVFDIMPNGQLRFAVYNKNGELVEASERRFGRAGKPVKCLWCHEIGIQPLHNINPSVAGKMSPERFKLEIANFMANLENYRNTLKGGVDFSKKQDHALMEILYISFMEPSLYKLEKEWGITSSDIKALYVNNNTHDHKEYSFLNRLLYRAAITPHSPYKTVQLPDSIWEKNNNEPNLFKQK